jgi:hypothetical protein
VDECDHNPSVLVESGHEVLVESGHEDQCVILQNVANSIMEWKFRISMLVESGRMRNFICMPL